VTEVARPGRGVPLVKVCGISRVQDAELAASLGAAAVGCVFWPESPRHVTIEVARAIARALPPFVAVVGVFVDQPFDDVLQVARDVPLTAVQFHGDEAADGVAAFPWRTVRALALEAPGVDEALARLPHTVTPLLDGYDRRRRGGTGKTVDWGRAAAVAARRRVILAGGLTPANVGRAVAQVRPWAVDVSSGVESSAGIKDARALQQFFAAVASSAEAGRW
jgi:phosphoribosylanthranilate isomerase